MSLINAIKLPDGSINGFLDADKLAYRRFKSRLKNLEVGELITFDVKLPRNSKYHRRYFALLNLGFEHWDAGRKHKKYKGVEVQKNFDRFREDVTILAGYFDQVFDLNGKMKLVAKSISFSNMEQDEFENLYSATINVLLDKVFTKYAGRAEVDEIVEQVMRFL